MSKRAPRPRKLKPGEDIGHVLPVLARAAADKSRAPKQPLSRSAALAAAPWDASFPAAWERSFRKAYADRLEELGVSLPARPGGTSGAPQSEEDHRARGRGRLALRMSQTAIDRLAVEAERLGCTQSAVVEAMVARIPGEAPADRRGAVVSRSVEITVPANADDCLADAAASYIAEHSTLRGWDLAPRWTDETRQTVTLSIPRYHYEAISDTSGT